MTSIIKNTNPFSVPGSLYINWVHPNHTTPLNDLYQEVFPEMPVGFPEDRAYATDPFIQAYIHVDKGESSALGDYIQSFKDTTEDEAAAVSRLVLTSGSEPDAGTFPEPVYEEQYFPPSGNLVDRRGYEDSPIIVLNVYLPQNNALTLGLAFKEIVNYVYESKFPIDMVVIPTEKAGIGDLNWRYIKNNLKIARVMDLVLPGIKVYFIEPPEYQDYYHQIKWWHKLLPWVDFNRDPWPDRDQEKVSHAF